MDNFSMVRRKTHFLIPGLNVNSVTVNNDDLNHASKGTSYRAVNIESYKHNGFNKFNNIRQDIDITNNKEDIFKKINEINKNFLDENKENNFDNINGIKHHFVNMNNRPNAYESFNDNSIRNKISLDEIDNLQNQLINIQNRGYNPETVNDPNIVNNKRNVYKKFTNMHSQFVNKNKADKLNNKADLNAAEQNKTKINDTLNEIADQPITDYYNEIAKIYEQFKHNDFDEYFTYEQELELLKILRKQEKIIQNITSTKKPKKKKNKKRKESTEFEDLVKDVEEQKKIVKSKFNYTDFTFETTPTTEMTVTTRRVTTVKSTTRKPTTILTVLNEMDVRTALKNDPYVKRILKMANMKRQKYVKNALLTIYN